MEFKPKAKTTARPIPIPRHAESPTVEPLLPAGALLAQGLQRLISTPVQSQRQAARPVLQAAGLRRQEEQRTLLQRQVLEQQARTVHLPTDTTRQVLLRQQAPPPPVPRQPQSPADWVTVMRAQAEQIEGRVTSSREAAQFSALQRQVAQTLVQGFRADRRPAQERHDSYAAHLVALQRHPSSAPVAGVVLGLIPQGERPALQRAVDLTLRREQAQAAQDQQALESLAIQRQLAELDAEATQPVLQRIQARRGGGNPLPAAVRRHLEQGLNRDLSQVRIHDDAEADKLAKGVNAVAFTTGTDIFFRRGQFNPNTQTGLELLAHEVTHTVQQSRGQVGTGIDPDAGLEREASTMGRRLANIKGIASKLEVDQTFRRPLPEGPRAIQRQKGASLVGDAAEITRLERRLKGLNADMALTMTQAAADVAGIVDPTPISDGISAAISLYRGDFLGAGLSVLSMIPGLGDAIAKPLKGSKLALKLSKLEKEIKLVTQQLAKATGKSLQTVEAAAKASRNVVKAEVLTRLPKNWTKIRGVIGKKYSRSILPSDYYEKIINGKPVIFRKPGLADDALVAPLSIENGKLVMKQATERLSDPVLMRANFKAKYGRASKPGYQIHHLIPDNLVRSHPLGQAAERLGVNLDRGNNLVELPGKTAHVTEGAKDVGHWSSHPKYDAIVTPLLTASQKALEKAYGSLDAVPKDVMEKTMDGIASRLNDLIRQKKVPLTKDGRLAAAPIPSSVQTA